MEIKRIVVGTLQENCYLVINNGHVLIVDPGDEFEKIDETIKKLKVDGILITHRHFDHIGALESLQNKYHVPVFFKNNLQEQEYKIGPFKFKVIFTPGHSSDSVTYYFDNIMFVGDFIFLGSIGRTDLETGSFKEIQKSIEKIKLYPENIIIYPGHGSSTTLLNEILYNDYF